MPGRRCRCCVSNWSTSRKCLTSRVRAALGQVREESWQGCATLQTCQVAEGLIQLTGWKTARRVIFARKLLGVIRGPENAEFWDRHKHEFAVYVTTLPANYIGWQIQELYRQRAGTVRWTPIVGQRIG